MLYNKPEKIIGRRVTMRVGRHVGTATTVHPVDSSGPYAGADAWITVDEGDRSASHLSHGRAILDISDPGLDDD